MMEDHNQYTDRDLSWLSFNYRVLMEATDPTVPLADRVKFLAIYSANLDEFFRVRVSSLRSLISLHKKKITKRLGSDPQQTLTQVLEVVDRQQNYYNRLFQEQLLPQLQQHGIILYQQQPLLEVHRLEVDRFFRSTVMAYLQPVFIGSWQSAKGKRRLPFLDSHALYLAVILRPKADGFTSQRDQVEESLDGHQFAYVNIPVDKLARFVTLSVIDEQHYFTFLDEVIRANLSVIFPGYELLGSFSFKLNRSEDIDIKDEYRGNLVKKIKRQLKKRQTAPPVRFLYDGSIDKDLLNPFTRLFNVLPDELQAGGRYHSLSALLKLPLPAGPDMVSPAMVPLLRPELDQQESMLAAINLKDRILHFPYQSYEYVLRLFNEAAIDPLVHQIDVTLYRIAADSLIANALISAAHNGKRVSVFVEVKARFDEANNLQWAEQLKAAGVRIFYSLPGIKVHAKMALIKRRPQTATDKPTQYAYLATGNFNEVTAEIYADHGLMTSHKPLVREVKKVFDYLEKQKPIGKLRHLLVSPFTLQDRYLDLIDREISFARKGRTARLTLKVNGLEESVLIDKLYEASRAGVVIDLLVRGICCLVPGVPGMSETIRVIRLVDRFLEHARVAIFHNDGQEEIFLASADWMTRNIYHRVEVGFPIYDPEVRTEIRQLIAFQLADNTKACLIDQQGTNQPIRNPEATPVRAQYASYDWLKQRASPESEPGIRESTAPS
ncbi:polyphosphate kinase 1 [Spirosoma endophyticum]|uniref:Polyphosphate kinase n=1 Tax=Spirosoma endophyticum TaxID=662367 RepID=A0A1I1VR25_9BACT|nr:polyphosphate kinase 1 [Spirosoma endophyticum]SFD82960.1 polyphosphate kinase [Spirosoma endophyticum]